MIRGTWLCQRQGHVPERAEARWCVTSDGVVPEELDVLLRHAEEVRANKEHFQDSTG